MMRYETGKYPLTTLNHAVDYLLDKRPMMDYGDIAAVASILTVQSLLAVEILAYKVLLKVS